MEQPQSFISLPHSAATTYSQQSKSFSVSLNPPLISSIFVSCSLLPVTFITHIYPSCLALSLPPFSVLYIFPCWGIMRASNSGWPCASHCIGVPWLIELANWKMPARPCRQHTVSVSLRKKRRRTHTIDFLTFPRPSILPERLQSLTERRWL